ncbi:hypothetical protein F5Y12DRAFT_600730 [Xylaria sp. FL1777]|nr:hypothetical protein F5Y12DRAFT_600730 [Xylaria sp. FL1777]
MPNLLRPQTYPYASSSTGPYQGLLVRKYPCWEAQGPVRDTFTNEIAGKIKECLEQCLPESNSFVGFSLFMVGKLPEKTKPTIMIVSDDKARRKAAFQMVKAKNILTMYPGFELGHCSVAAEFEDLRQLGVDTEPSASILESIEDYEDLQYIDDDEGDPGEEVLSLLSAEVCAFEFPSPTKATRLFFHTSPHSHSHSHNFASATCGGLFEFENEIYALTMAHAICLIRSLVTNLDEWETRSESSQSDDCEITGMDDWDDEDDEGDTKTLTAITSPGSKTPSELSDSEGSLLKRHNSQRSSDTSIQTRVTSAPSVIYEDDCVADTLDIDDDLPQICERVGSVVSVDNELDIAVVKLKPDRYKMFTSFAYSLPHMWMRHRHAKDNLTNTPVVVKTTHHPEISGQRSGTPFYTRFPGTSNFLELHSVQLSTSLRPGDSGSWAFDSQGEVVGFVVAGNPKSGSCLLLPIMPVLQSMFVLLHRRVSAALTLIDSVSEEMEDEPLLFDMSEINRDQSRRGLDDNGDNSRITNPDGGLPLCDLPPNMQDDDAMTVASSLPPSIFSPRMDRGSPSTVSFSTTTSLYERKPNTPQAQESLPRGNADSVSSFVSRGDILQDQVAKAKVRRKPKRAWEIIQDYDKRLQKYITGDKNYGLDVSMKNATRLQHDAYNTLHLGSWQDLAQTQRQSSSPEPPPSQTTIASEFSREGSLELPSLSDPTSLRKLEALKTELETNRTVTEEMRTMWRTQVDANEALIQENNRLKRFIKYAAETVELELRNDDHLGLRVLASEMRGVLQNIEDSPAAPIVIEAKKEPKPEPNETPLMDIPPFPSQKPTPGPLVFTDKLVKPPSRRIHWRRPQGPGSSSTFPSSSFSGTMRGIDRVLEEDEDEDSKMTDRAVRREEDNGAHGEIKTKDGFSPDFW